MTFISPTHVKNAQLVNKLCSQRACNKLANKFVAMLSFCQVVPSLRLTTCWQVVDLQPDNKLLEQTCNKAVEFIKLVASLLQACSNLVNKLGTTSASASCQQVVVQTCCKSAAGLLQVVRFYVCTCAKSHTNIHKKYCCTPRDFCIIIWKKIAPKPWMWNCKMSKIAFFCIDTISHCFNSIPGKEVNIDGKSNIVCCQYFARFPVLGNLRNNLATFVFWAPLKKTWTKKQWLKIDKHWETVIPPQKLLHLKDKNRLYLQKTNVEVFLFIHLLGKRISFHYWKNVSVW